MRNENCELKVSTPGRVCLFGEHQDYLNLPIIACAISLRINIEGIKRKDSLVNISLPDINDKEEFPINKPLKYGKERDYFKSSINVLKRHGFTFKNGVDCTVRGNIPINSGTSSSSALIVTWINFLTQMSDQAKVLKPEQISKYAYEAEVLEFAEPGGMMDQYSTSIGGIIFLESFPKIQVQKINAKLGKFVLGDSEEPKDTMFILSRVKKQIQKVAKRLENQYPEFSLQTINECDIDNYSKNLKSEQVELLKGTIKNREITKQAKKVLGTSHVDHRAIGKLLTEHHTVLRDILKISTPKIEKMIDASLKAGAYGAKINGSGGGGCMFAYAPKNAEKVKEAIEQAGGVAYIVNADLGTHSNMLEIAQ